MPGLFKAIIFLIVFTGVTAAVWSFIVPETDSNEKPTVTTKGKICNEDVDFTVTGNKAATQSDISISKALSLAIGLLIAIIVLLIL
jgi:hypothetical protein